MTDHDAAAPSERSSYWDHYYAAASTKRQLPSQFAAFVAGELVGRNRIVELGSGTGRDALFFAEHGHEVLGVDGSAEGIDHCVATAADRGLEAQFVASRIDAPDLAERIGTASGPTLVYARFFLHAINDEEETALLEVAAAITRPGDLVALEYRTDRDSTAPKVTDTHYRRFVRPPDFHAHAGRHGFDVSYAVQGFGFAKYRDDDAFVARDLLVRRTG